MPIVKRILFFVTALVMVIFILQNQSGLGQPFELIFFNFRHNMVLGIWLLLSFLCGALMWFLLDWRRNFMLGRDIRQKEKDIARLESEMEVLKSQTRMAENDGKDLSSSTPI